MAASTMEGPIDDIHLLLSGEADEVDGVPGHPDRQLRVPRVVVRTRGVRELVAGCVKGVDDA